MKKFVFTLQRLYDVKQNEEKRKREELEELNRMMNDYKRVLQELEAGFAVQKAKFEEKCQSGIGANDLKNFSDYFLFLNGEIQQQHTLIENCQRKIEECTQELVKLMNEQKVLDRMREEQLAEYNIEVQRDSEKSIEDFMQSRSG